MKIDIFPHILPEKYFKKLVEKAPSRFYMDKRFKGIPCLTDLEKRFQIMDEFEDYVQVLTLSSPPLEVVLGPQDTPEMARMANDEMAELVTKYPNRFVAAAACLPMNNKDAAADELERAIKKLDMRGIQIFTNINGRPVDDQEFSFIFEAMAEYDLPIWLHPARSVNVADYTTEDRSRYDIWFCFGWPYETSAAMTRILFSGAFDTYPNLKIITHHFGGMVPYFDERIRATYDQFGTRTDEPRSLLGQLKRHPCEYFKMFYADTALHGASMPALKCGLAFFGSDRVLFGSDMPFDVEKGYKYIRQAIEATEGMTSSRNEKKKIYEGNARRLLKL
jgi:predicted TIM-barrel fold metal-dependent hydrolase